MEGVCIHMVVMVERKRREEREGREGGREGEREREREREGEICLIEANLFLQYPLRSSV